MKLKSSFSTVICSSSHIMSTNENINYIVGITYRNQPENVTAELDGKVFFPCVRDTDGNGSVPAPHWQIKFSNSSIITTTSQRDLPLNHVSNETGLSVMVEDIELNITAYRCYYLIFIPYGETYCACPIYSNTGYLTIKFPYTTFYLRLYSTTHVRVGESISYSVIKTGGGDFTFNVTVSTTGKSHANIVLFMTMLFFRCYHTSRLFYT